MSGSWLPEEFPNLTESDHQATSKAKINYNCFAWAAEETHRRWDPNAYYWPPSVAREITKEAFIEAYATRGFELCDGPELEPGFQKIAIYLDKDGDPTHAARQLENGNWTSKLGDHEDIEHFNLNCLEGPGAKCYGKVGLYMKRPRKGADHPPES